MKHFEILGKIIKEGRRNDQKRTQRSWWKEKRLILFHCIIVYYSIGFT